MDFSKLTLGEKIVAGAGLLLLIFMLVLDWHSVRGFGVKAMEGEGEAVAWPAFLAFLLTIAVVAAVLIRKLTTTKLPDLPIAWKQAIFYASIAVPVLLILKLLLKNEIIAGTAYLMILTGAAMAYGGFLISRDPETASPGSGPATPF